MKVLFAGTPDFAVPPLRALHKEHEIVGVFTQPDAKVGRGKKLTPPIVKRVAQELGLDVYQPQSLRDQVDLIKSLAPDVMVVVAYGVLLPQSVLDIPPFGCLNIHASILPRWRGAAPIHRAIEAGDAQTGVSIMQMELGLDTGPVYQTLFTDIQADDTTPSLHDRLAELGAEGICSTLKQLIDMPELPAVQQDQLNNGLHANYAKKILKSEVEIDWSQSAAQLDQRIRAFVPWPICQSHLLVGNSAEGSLTNSLNNAEDSLNNAEDSLNNAEDSFNNAEGSIRIRISKASISGVRQAEHAQVGEIIALDDTGVHVQCGEGVLALKRLQRDGNKALDIKEFLNGYSLNVGQKFSPPRALNVTI